MSRIKLYVALEGDRERKAFILVSGDTTVGDAIQQLHDQNIVQEIWQEKRVEFVGILPRSHLLQEDYKRDMAIVPMHNNISDSYVADDIVLVRRAVPSVVDLCDGEDDSTEGSLSNAEAGEGSGRSMPVKKSDLSQDIHQLRCDGDRQSQDEGNKVHSSSDDDDDDEENGASLQKQVNGRNHRAQWGRPLWMQSKFTIASRPTDYMRRGKKTREDGHVVYYCLNSETPTSIAAKFGVPGGGERIVHDNRGLYNHSRAEKLHELTHFDAGSAIVLPIEGRCRPRKEANVTFSVADDVISEGRFHREENKVSSAVAEDVTQVARATKAQKQRKWGKILSKDNLPRSGSGVPGGEPVCQHEYSRRVYTCLGGETPKVIANKFGYDDPEELVYHNKGIYSTRATKLEADVEIKGGSIFLLPLQHLNVSNEDEQDKGGAARSQSPRKRRTPPATSGGGSSSNDKESTPSTTRGSKTDDKKQQRHVEKEVKEGKEKEENGWTCYGCQRIHNATKKRCPNCYSWKGGKRPNPAAVTFLQPGSSSYAPIASSSAASAPSVASAPGASAKKRTGESQSKEALAEKERKRGRKRREELEIYVRKIMSDGVPNHIKSSNPPPFNNASPGSLILEEGRFDRRIYVCRGGETPLEIAKKQGVYSPNPAGRILFDNRAKHRGIKAYTPMKQGAILVLPPIQSGPHRADADDSRQSSLHHCINYVQSTPAMQTTGTGSTLRHVLYSDAPGSSGAPAAQAAVKLESDSL